MSPRSHPPDDPPARAVPPSHAPGHQPADAITDVLVDIDADSADAAEADTTPTLDPPTRQRLIDAAYRTHAAPLVRLATYDARRHGLDDSVAHDLVHTAFLRLASGQRDAILCRDAAGLARYLYATVRAGCKSFRRDEQTQQRGEWHAGDRAVAVTPFASPESEVAVQEIMAVLEHIIATSTPVQGQAMHLVRVLGYSQSQAAALMGVTVKVVEHSLVRPTLRARRALRHWREAPARGTEPGPRAGADLREATS